ncbi:hypothetical protein [Arthrobacter sp. Cr_A7]|uniref:hypothetical protein n=1 Tax=Arthrobacter sp. Cr_A7 TaxID=3031017 RepID=UPI0023DCB7BA|nr:hypothetical protein [Arthrobacter sp. Cr_A7]MDF2050279.1 hypothetical protein [Arthrobacter sp. Cr_A7]
MKVVEALTGRSSHQVAPPTGRYIKNWNVLKPGQIVEVLNEHGLLIIAEIDALTDDHTIIWLRSLRSGQRTLHLVEDPISLYEL